MTIRLTREQEQLIEQRLATGRYANRSEVISEALVLLQQQDDTSEMREIFAQVHKRNAELDLEDTIDLIEEVVREHRQGDNR